MDSFLLYLIITIEATFIIFLTKNLKERLFYRIYSILILLTFVIRPIILSSYDVMMHFVDLKIDVNIDVLVYCVLFNVFLISILYVLKFKNINTYNYSDNIIISNNIIKYLIILLSLLIISIAYIIGSGLITTFISSSLLLILLNYFLYSTNNKTTKFIIFSLGLLSASVNGRTFPVLMLILLLSNFKIGMSFGKVSKYLSLIIFIIFVTVTLDQNRFILLNHELNLPDFSNLIDIAVQSTYAFSFYDSMLALFSVDFTPTFGLDFFRTALVLFPRILFPYKPSIYGTELEFTDLIIDYDGSTFIPSIVGISYFWFGYAGIFLGPLILVVGVDFIGRLIGTLKLQNSKNLILILVSFKVFRSGFDWIFLYSFFVILPIFLTDRFIWNNYICKVKRV